MQIVLLLPWWSTSAQNCPGGKLLFPFIQRIYRQSKISLLPSDMKGKSRMGNKRNADKCT